LLLLVAAITAGVFLGDSQGVNVLRLSPGRAFADSALCVSTGDTTVSFDGDSQNPDTLNVAIVWVGFADSAWCDTLRFNRPDTLPSWFREVETDFEKYMDWQSYGRMYVDATTALPSGTDSLMAWNLG
jgi:hypothetical protein